MNRLPVHVAASLLSILLVSPGHAAESAAAPVPAPAPSSALSEIEPRLPAHRLSPMMAEIFAVIDAQRAKVAALRAERGKGPGGLRSLELERALSVAKHETELRLLRIQADYARREGRLEAAGQLEAAITAMSAPAVSSGPVARPAVSPESGR